MRVGLGMPTDSGRSSVDGRVLRPEPHLDRLAATCRTGLDEEPQPSAGGLDVGPQRRHPGVAAALEPGQVGLSDAHRGRELLLGQAGALAQPAQRHLHHLGPAVAHLLDPAAPEPGRPVHRVGVDQVQDALGASSWWLR